MSLVRAVLVRLRLPPLTATSPLAMLADTPSAVILRSEVPSGWVIVPLAIENDMIASGPALTARDALLIPSTRVPASRAELASV